jgi:hypothetical protein
MIWVGSRLKAQLQQERIALKPHFKGVPADSLFDQF